MSNSIKHVIDGGGMLIVRMVVAACDVREWGNAMPWMNEEMQCCDVRARIYSVCDS